MQPRFLNLALFALFALAAVAAPALAADTGKDAPPPALPEVKLEPRVREDVPIPPKVTSPDDETAPAVSIRQVGGSTVEEYRHGSRLYMVVVHQERGPDLTFLDADGDGRLEPDPRDGPIAPVYYTIYRFK
jgi:hypothetical protein